MPSTNLYFNNFEFSQEQNLIEDLIIESIKIYGIECYYLPRTLVREDELFGEDALAKFDIAFPIEMYIKSIDGFQGDGDFLSKFGLEIRDSMVLTIAQRRFEDEVHITETTPFNEAEGIGRPSEGDLVYFPLNGKIFEVKFVEHESIFYQMGSLQTYDLSLSLFTYNNEILDTGLSVVDNIEEKFSTDRGIYELLTEAGEVLVFEDGASIVREDYDISQIDSQANNEYFTTSSIDFLDFSES